MLKRLLTLILHVILWLVVAAVLLCILADVVCEVHGLPDAGANIVRSRFAEQGLHLRAESIRAGLINGLVIDHARIRMNYADMPVLLQCRQFRARPRLMDLWRGRRGLPSARFDAAAMAAAQSFSTKQFAFFSQMSPVTLSVTVPFPQSA